MTSYLNKRKKAFGYAWEGIRTLFKGEAHAKIHLIAAGLVIVAGFVFRLDKAEWCAVILCIGIVFMAEGFNTALERVCDKVSPERNPLIKDAKDIAAGAVLLFVLSAVAVGLIIFIPKIAMLFQ
ncbi:MAG: diacylglycerol kinase family protein [Muribaculaceae bacterium]|nr:diacylglycerol kinase family protein [Muribaculaceae bacterium]